MADFSGPGGAFNVVSTYDLNRAIHIMSPESWDAIFRGLYGYEEFGTVYGFYQDKLAIQSFFGLDLVTPSGWGWPGIIIPILSVASMAYSSWQTMKINPATDPQQKMMQKIMLFVMPVMFGWFTIQVASGVGLYWAAGNIFLIIQNIIVFKFFPHKIGRGEAVENGKLPKMNKEEKAAKKRDKERNKERK
jgi:membrane protein insertase Oxa1/YidC/SpoIIIJ